MPDVKANFNTFTKDWYYVPLCIYINGTYSPSTKRTQDSKTPYQSLLEFLHSGND